MLFNYSRIVGCASHSPFCMHTDLPSAQLCRQVTLNSCAYRCMPAHSLKPCSSFTQCMYRLTRLSSPQLQRQSVLNPCKYSCMYVHTLNPCESQMLTQCMCRHTGLPSAQLWRQSTARSGSWPRSASPPGHNIAFRLCRPAILPVDPINA